MQENDWRKDMKVNINLTVKVGATDPVMIEAALRALESIEIDHPDLFQQAEMVISF